MTQITDLKNVSIDNIGLSNRAMNALHLAGFHFAEEILNLTEDQLYSFRNIGTKTVNEILAKIVDIKRNVDVIIDPEAEKIAKQRADAVSRDRRELYMDRLEQLYQYVEENDIDLRVMGLSRRPMNCLQNAGCSKFSDVIRMTEEDIRELPSMGGKSIEEVIAFINDYLDKHEKRLNAFLEGDVSALWDDDMLRGKIKALYNDIGFKGLSLGEMSERLQLPEHVTEKQLKQAIGSLLAAGELEYVDFRCHRVYATFEECLGRCSSISDRDRDFLRRRLLGDTLESIGQDHGMTRERVRQIVKKARTKVRDWYLAETGKGFFDEDFYRYFYENYAFRKDDAEEWFGILPHVWKYLDMFDSKQGKKDLAEALRDQQLSMGLRLKIQNYQNRNKLFIGGKWVEKQRAALEDALMRRICSENIAYEDFVKAFNAALEEEGVPFDEEVYITDSVYMTRKNRLSESRLVLWKQYEQMRYYDIDSRDYEELLETLNLESYENIELSTLKFIEEYPDVMARYDIRDQYELHNLFRKILQDGDYHDLTFKKMPTIRFGTFDRDKVIFELMASHSPIEQSQFVDLIHEEFGYDKATIVGSYLNHLGKYCVGGVFTMAQKVMSPEHMRILSRALSDDCYFIDEIKKIYADLVPGADEEEINQYNLNSMGFNVFSKAVVQNYSTMDAYFRSVLMAEELADIRAYRKRFSYVQQFFNALNDLKSSLEIVEYEPNQIVRFSRLEKKIGLTRDMVEDFRDAVDDFVEDGTFFSVRSLRSAGFTFDLDYLGFGDFFYTDLLLSDGRFSYGRVFGVMIFHKGEADVTRQSFLLDRVTDNESIDVYDLMDELTDIYGCDPKDDRRHDIMQILSDTPVYYDDILDRLYKDEDTFFSELEGGDV